MITNVLTGGDQVTTSYSLCWQQVPLKTKKFPSETGWNLFCTVQRTRQGTAASRSSLPSPHNSRLHSRSSLGRGWHSLLAGEETEEVGWLEGRKSGVMFTLQQYRPGLGINGIRLQCYNVMTSSYMCIDNNTTEKANLT